MKTTDFEKLLSRQPVRGVPSDWREDILEAARAAAPSATASAGAESVAWWRTWLWPCPQAWAGLAAAWCVILGVNLALQQTSPPLACANAPTPTQVRLAFEEQRRLLAELNLPRRLTPDPAVQPFLPRPRSHRPTTYVVV